MSTSELLPYWMARYYCADDTTASDCRPRLEVRLSATTRAGTEDYFTRTMGNEPDGAGLAAGFLIPM